MACHSSAHCAAGSWLCFGEESVPKPGAQAVLGGGSDQPYLPAALKAPGELADPSWSLEAPDMARSQLPRKGRQPGMGPQEQLLSLAGGKWMGTVQSGPRFELLLWSAPQGPTLCEPSLGLPPVHVCFEESSKKINSLEVGEEVGAEAECLSGASWSCPSWEESVDGSWKHRIIA